MIFATTIPLLATPSQINPIILVLVGLFSVIVIINVVCAIVNAVLYLAVRRAVNQQVDV